MHYYLYEIRNILNDKVYVGVHKTKNLDDGYMGSGKVIRRAIEKHGVENFTKTILETFEDATSMYAREKDVVTQEFLEREDTYNLRRGGHGGFDYINKHILSTEDRRKNGRIGGLKSNGIILSKEQHDKINAHNKLHNKGVYNSEVNLRARSIILASEEIKARRRETFKRNLHGVGNNNSQYGTCWIYNEDGNKKIKKDDLQHYLDEGYTKGRSGKLFNRI